MTDHSLNEVWDGRFIGRVRQAVTGVDGIKRVISDSPNLVVDAALEIMVRALMGEDRIAGVEFGNSGGAPISRGLRTIQAPVAFANSGSSSGTRPFVSRDSSGLRSIGTWTSTLTPDQNLTYDTLGLVGASNLLFAAIAFDSVSLVIGETISVQWTILLRGG